jgi:hypothetical protein
VALTAQQEVFAKKIALENMGQSAAYSCAYNTSKMTAKTVTEAASRLAAADNVRARIDVLRQGATRAALKAAAYSIDDAISDAEEDRVLARNAGQGSAAVAATKLKAQLAGHLVEKKADAKGALEDMDLERLLELRKAVEDKVARSREALAMTDAPAPVATPAPIRRVI